METILSSIDAASIVRPLFSVPGRAAGLLVEYLRGSPDAEPPAELLGELMRGTRTKLGRLATSVAAGAAPDRHGGFKSVYFDEDRVLGVTKPLRTAVARQALLELLVQYAMYEDGCSVPAVYGALLCVCSTPTVGLYQVVSHSERMQCTLAEYLTGAEYGGLDAVGQTNAIVAMLCAVCRTLARLSSEFQIRHADLKPDNIMQRHERPSKRDPTRGWCLIDFGQIKAETKVGGDLFFLLWWLVGVYKKHVPRKLLKLLSRALDVPASAVGIALSPPIKPDESGTVRFSARIERSLAIGDDAWSKQHGLTKSELYAVQRSISVPALEPTRFVRVIRRLYRAKPDAET